MSDIPGCECGRNPMYSTRQAPHQHGCPLYGRAEEAKPEGMSTHEPMPVPDPTRGNVQDLVIADIEERKRVGIARYGTPLQTFNGRDAMVDLYQELLDACMYVRQIIEERKYVNSGDLNDDPFMRDHMRQSQMQDIDQTGSGYPERYASGTIRRVRETLPADALAVRAREWEQRVTDARAAGPSTQHQPRVIERLIDTGLDAAEHIPGVGDAIELGRNVADIVDHDPA